MRVRGEVAVLDGWRVAVVTACLASCLSWGTTAWASDDSEALFHSGVDAFNRQDYRAAAVLFERAFAQSQLAPVLYNAGMSWKLASEDARAADALALALERGGLEPDQRAQAEAAYRQIEGRLGRLRLSGAAGASVTIGHKVGAGLPLEVHLLPGRHALVVEGKDGTRRRQFVQVVGGREQALSLQAPPASRAASSAPLPQEPGAPATSGSAVPWAALCLGGSVVALGVGTYFQLGALSDRDRWDELGNRREHVEVRDRAALKNRVAIASFTAAGVLGVAGVAVLLSAPATQPGVGLHLAPGHAAVRGRF